MRANMVNRREYESLIFCLQFGTCLSNNNNCFRLARVIWITIVRFFFFFQKMSLVRALCVFFFKMIYYGWCWDGVCVCVLVKERSLFQRPHNLSIKLNKFKNRKYTSLHSHSFIHLKCNNILLIFFLSYTVRVPFSQ